MRRVTIGLHGILLLAARGGSLSGAELEILLPLGRTVCSTEERIDLCVVREDDRAP